MYGHHLVSVRRIIPILILVLFASDGFTEPTLPEPGYVGDGRIRAILEQLRSANNLPALAGFILEGEDLREIAATGRRVANETGEVTAEDRWHIGSNTKAMTATLAAIYVERNQLKWDATLEELLPSQISIHPGYQNVQYRDLLTHHAGLPANSLKGYLKPSRRELTNHVLALPPETTVGEFLYSNVGYIIAGYILEGIAGDTWENLLLSELCKPLSISAAGFGAPAFPTKRDQPWGHARHQDEWFPLDPTQKLADNPAILGPAGTVHITLTDYAKFVSLHLLGAQGKPHLISEESFRVMHTPAEESAYALGWGVMKRDWGNGAVLTHSGSNNMWFATVWIAPQKNLAVFAVTNAGGKDVDKAIDDTCSVLIRRALAQEQ